MQGVVFFVVDVQEVGRQFCRRIAGDDVDGCGAAIDKSRLRDTPWSVGVGTIQE